jgi:hypothetical protein
MGLSMLFPFLILMVSRLSPLTFHARHVPLRHRDDAGRLSFLRVMSSSFSEEWSVFSLMDIPFFILAGILLNRFPHTTAS